jgi:hypothetical protein
VEDEEQAAGVTAVFNYERDIPGIKHERYLCDGFLGTWPDAPGDFEKDIDITLLSFTHTADTVRGSSGSPVLNRKHQVIGIHKAESAHFMVNIATALRNVPPQANAGDDQDVIQGSKVNLDGSKSITLFGPLRFAWRIVQKPTRSQARLSNATIPDPTFIADREGEYILELKVRDRRGATATDRVTIKAIAMNVAFVSVRDGYYEVYAMNSTGERVARLTNNPYADWHVKLPAQRAGLLKVNGNGSRVTKAEPESTS